MRTPVVAVVAGDMPYAGPALERLVAALRTAPPEVGAAVATDDAGVANPLLAAYRTASRARALPIPAANRPAKMLLAVPHVEVPGHRARRAVTSTPRPTSRTSPAPPDLSRRGRCRPRRSCRHRRRSSSSASLPPPPERAAVAVARRGVVPVVVVALLPASSVSASSSCEPDSASSLSSRRRVAVGGAGGPLRCRSPVAPGRAALAVGAARSGGVLVLGGPAGGGLRRSGSSFAVDGGGMSVGEVGVVVARRPGGGPGAHPRRRPNAGGTEGGRRPRPPRPHRPRPPRRPDRPSHP